jgi:hypothetical protein
VAQVKVETILGFVIITLGTLTNFPRLKPVRGGYESMNL